MGPWGPLGPFGLFRNYSEWKAIPSERSSRMEGHPKGAVLGHLRVALLHVANVLRGPTTQAQGAKGWGPWGPLGLFRNCSEWKAILSERLSRMEGHPNAQWKLNGCSLVGGTKMVPLQLLESYSEGTPGLAGITKR